MIPFRGPYAGNHDDIIKWKHFPRYWPFVRGTHLSPVNFPRLLGQVSDRDAPHRPSTRNATRVKKGGRNYTFCPLFMKNMGRNTTFSLFLLKYRGQNTIFSSFLLKYRGRNHTTFPETWKRGVEMEEHICSVGLADLIRTTNAMVVLFSLAEFSLSRVVNRRDFWNCWRFVDQAMLIANLSTLSIMTWHQGKSYDSWEV